jgi:hypothetical protein
MLGPFPDHFDVARVTPTLEFSGTHWLQRSVCGAVSLRVFAFLFPNPSRRSHRLCHSFALSSKLDQVSSVGMWMARRYPDGLMRRLFLIKA